MSNKKLSRRAALYRVLTYQSLEPLKNVDLGLCPLLHCCMALPAHEFDMLASWTRLTFKHRGIYFHGEFARSYKKALATCPAEANRRAKIVLGVYRPPWDSIYEFSRVEYKADKNTPVTKWYVTNFPSQWRPERADGNIANMYIRGFKSLDVLLYVEKIYNVTAHQVYCPVQALRFMDNIHDLPTRYYRQYNIPDRLFIKILEITEPRNIIDYIQTALYNAKGRFAQIYQKQLIYIAQRGKIKIVKGQGLSGFTSCVLDLIEANLYSVPEFNLVNMMILQPILTVYKN